MYQNLEAILLFYLKHGHCHQDGEKKEKKTKKKNDKSVDLCY